MLVALSGAQGQGKSTILASLKDEGYNTLDVRTSRNCLKDINMSLSDVMKHAPLMASHQIRVINRHYETLQMYSEMESLYFCERSFADIYAYALLVLGPHNEYNDWLVHFHEQCLEYQKEVFHSVIYLAGNHIKTEDDGVRSTNMEFGKIVDSIIYQKLQIFSENIVQITTSDHTERVNLIKDYYKDFI